MRRADARLRIDGISRQVVDASPIAAADVPLDVACSAVSGSGVPGVPVGDMQAFAPAPVPGRDEFSAPQSPLCRLRRRFLLHVRSRVSAVCQRPSLADQPGVDVSAAVPADGDDASVMIPLFAHDRAAIDAAGQRWAARRPQGQRRLPSRQICLPSGASMPQRRTRSEPISIVSPSSTRAMPDRWARVVPDLRLSTRPDTRFAVGSSREPDNRSLTRDSIRSRSPSVTGPDRSADRFMIGRGSAVKGSSDFSIMSRT